MMEIGTPRIHKTNPRIFGKLDFLLKVPRTYKATKERSPGEGNRASCRATAMADCCYNLQTPRYGFWLRAYPKMSSVQESSGSAKKFGDGNIDGGET